MTLSFSYCDTCGKYGLRWFRIKRNWWVLVEPDSGKVHECPDPILDDQYQTTIGPPHPCILCSKPVRRITGFSVFKKKIQYMGQKDSMKPHNCPVNVISVSNFNSD